MMSVPDRAREWDGAVALDRDGPLPLYYQLQEALLREIRERGLRPGDQLPTEADLERRFGVSRSTIRQALNELAAEGVIERIQGKGTFVGAPKPRHTGMLASFTESMLSQGHVPSRRVLESRVEGAAEDVAARLGIEAGTPCRFLLRLLLADERVVGISHTWLPEAILGGHDELFEAGRLEERSLYEVLQAPPVGLVLHRGVETITPATADEEQARLLGCAPGSPVLIVTRLSFAADGRAVEWTHMAFAGDRYEYRVEMAPPPRGRGR